MPRTHLFVLIIVFALVPAAATGCRDTKLNLYDLNADSALSGGQAIERLKQLRVILVGEHHNNPRHHEAQLAIVRALHEAGQPVAVGLEMFRRDSQPVLDRWVAGDIGESDFVPIYLDNWNYDWGLYRSIFEYARQNRVPMVGLNVPRSVTRQVAARGFDSLSADQKRLLGDIACEVTDDYRRFIERAYGGHGHGKMNFESFCEAQLVWDTAMAVHAVDYIADNPRTTLVVLAGSGHARKMGIPTRIKERGPWPLAVILPETPGVFDRHHLDASQADYLLTSP